METPEETTTRLRTDGYLANCDTHGNQTFPWRESTRHAHCPVPDCRAEVCDFRICDVEAAGHAYYGMCFWRSGPWKSVAGRMGLKSQ